MHETRSEDRQEDLGPEAYAADSAVPEESLDEASESDPEDTELERQSDPGSQASQSNEAREAQRDHAEIRAALEGDADAFAKLVRRHQGRAFRVARNMVASDEDAQDLAQEAFLRVFRSLDRFNFQHNFTTWLYRIVTNLAIDHLRKRRPAMSTAGQDDDEADLDLVDERVERPSARLERAETADEVHACLETLAPHFQAVLVLRELQGLPCTEIAEIVGATHVTVRWRLHRGRKLFQEEWERRQRFAAEGGAGFAAEGGLSGLADGAQGGTAADGGRAGLESSSRGRVRGTESAPPANNLQDPPVGTDVLSEDEAPE